MTRQVTMPQLGETVTEGTVTRWLRAEGEAVLEGEALLEISTDKVHTEIPAPASGLLRGPLAAVGETLGVGALLGTLENSGDFTSGPETPAPQTGSAATSARTEPAQEVASMATRMSPLVRRLTRGRAAVASIHGTGEGGRVTARDVLNAAPSSYQEPEPPSANGRVGYGSPSAESPAAHSSSTGPAPSVTTVPMSRVRQLTARRTLQSLLTSAHVLSVVEVDYNNVDRVREPRKDAWKEANGHSLTYLPFVCAAVTRALKKYPHLNASVDGTSLQLHRRVDLGIAVDLGDQGLVVPVVVAAEDLTAGALARRVSSLAGRARAGNLTADELGGGTFTVTNNGGSGSVLTAPIIVQPQVAILSTDAAVRRPVVVSAGGLEAIAVRNVGNLSMSWDHRAVDGAYAAQFLSTVKHQLETYDWSRDF
jgi:pyruvate dehydrogenase E2 component (dihydrolipoamide acetyltransferase)